MKLTLTQLFGEGATQTANILTIEKSALRGLTSSSNNNSEQKSTAEIQDIFTAINNTFVIY
ncbi:hypothetical protein NIES4075_44520 [Tolypothrix sp. NIES-4075]|uniref:hypothetical protein n=1 Tax=Tolypothrix sp. NIES-4075 TaxID=2005459 RepID=UPI000B5C9808|nr:hypothetical protein [Tolypothrix sp. NIES-4075]GAX43439.1 hypothetical protein NIES4075_44520 [Tolypothrix sp. NIES-4075]